MVRSTLPSMNETEQKVFLPPFVTCRVCRNSMNEKCFEECAPARDYSWFEVRKCTRLEDLPRFPLKQWDEMPAKVRSKVIAVYIAKIFDHLVGYADG